jgi:hypothetical protein
MSNANKIVRLYTSEIETKTELPPKNFSTKIELITPNIAQKYRASMLVARNIPDTTVYSYANDMLANKWRFIGDTIRFDDNGHMIDGGHRMTAIIRSGVSQYFVVIRGLDPEAVKYIDTGRARRADDVLTMMGLTNTAKLAAAARVLYNLKHGTILRKTKVSTAQILSIIERHPGLHESCRTVLTLPSARPGLLAAMHYIASSLLKNKQLADDFREVFKSGVQAYPSLTAAVRLREWRLANHKNNIVISANMELRGLIHAWNLCVKGNKTKSAQIIPNKEVSIEGLDINTI